MTYPQAIVIAAALVAGAFLLSDRTDAASSSGAAVSSGPPDAWVVSADGAVRYCRGSGFADAPLAVCSHWVGP